jgi:type II secretory pathway component PulM
MSLKKSNIILFELKQQPENVQLMLTSTITKQIFKISNIILFELKQQPENVQLMLTSTITKKILEEIEHYIIRT